MVGRPDPSARLSQSLYHRACRSLDTADQHSGFAVRRTGYLQCVVTPQLVCRRNRLPSNPFECRQVA